MSNTKHTNPVLTIFRLLVNLITAWMVVEAGHSLDNTYVTVAGWTLLVGWLMGFIERYETR
jgi:hypothetical protein